MMVTRELNLYGSLQKKVTRICVYFWTHYGHDMDRVMGIAISTVRLYSQKKDFTPLY